MTFGHRRRVGLWLLAVLLAGAGPALAMQAWRLGPDRMSLRHPTLPSIQITTGPTLPAILLFHNPDLSGPAAGRLDAEGLYLDQRLVCRWHDAWDGYRMLGHALGSTRRDAGCPADVPFSTKVTDAGLGHPYLFIAISGLDGAHAEVRFGVRRLYFDTTRLPGAPRLGAPPPPALQRDGLRGWSWLESQRTADLREGAVLEDKLRDPVFARFYHGLRRCLMGQTPRCLTQYLHPDFAFEPWWTPHDTRVARADFPRFAWRSSDGESPLWRELAWCFLRGRIARDGNDMTFMRGFFQCRVLEYSGGYGVGECTMVE